MLDVKNALATDIIGDDAADVAGVATCEVLSLVTRTVMNKFTTVIKIAAIVVTIIRFDICRISSMDTPVSVTGCEVPNRRRSRYRCHFLHTPVHILFEKDYHTHTQE